MKFAVPVTMLLCSAITAGAEEPEHYLSYYFKDTFGVEALATSAAGAAIGQWQDSPHEWGGKIDGYGKRFGSTMGIHIVKNTVEFGVASARHEELTYHRSQKTGFGPRLKYALLRTVVTRNTTTGESTLALGRISGNFAGGFISRLWQPPSEHTVGSGFESTAILFGVDAGVLVLREFWQDIRHPHHN